MTTPPIHVFDFDGTIANTEPLHWKTHQQLLSDYGVTLTEQHIQSYIGKNDFQIFSAMEKDFNIPLGDKKELKEKRLKLFLDLIHKVNLKPFPNIVTDIKENEENYILSSQAKFVVEQLLSEWNLLKYFKSIISLENSNQSKLDVIRTIGKKENIVWYEDNIPLVNKAQRLGYSMVLVKTI